MNIYYKIIPFIILFISCDYLDIVPDERVTEENLYETPQAMRNFLYSCYGYLPTNRLISNNAFWRLSAKETSFYRKEDFSLFSEGDYSPSSIGMTKDTWGPVWQGVRQCYLMLSFLDDTKNLPESDRRQYRAEANFLIAYYHFISLRTYGPTLIMDRLFDQNDPISEFPERSSVDEVVDFINNKLDEALPNLAKNHGGQDYGRATKFTALALKSRMYLYAASPLFNGNSEMYSNFKSKLDDRHLISQEFEIRKWEKSAEISKTAIDEMEAAGFRLYHDKDAGTPDANKPGIPNPEQRRIRYSIMDYNGNPEVIWADTREEDWYSTQNRSAPKSTQHVVYAGNGGIAPTLQTVEMFYTENGLPINRDKTYDFNGRYDITNLPPNHSGNNYSDISTGTSIKLHLEREPRFYAHIGFHNGFAEISRYNGETVSNGDPFKSAIILKMRNNDPNGRQNQTLYYSVTGYQNKKYVHPAYQTGPVHYPLSLFRLAEIYLNYAEALVELDKLEEAKIYVDKVRERAGIPTIDDAWNNYSDDPGYQNTKEGMRDIVRRERDIELYLEGHKFFDIRRWLIAEQYLDVPDLGLNVSGNTDEEFFKVAEVPLTRKFHIGQYLMPIDAREIDKVPQLVQNPYY